MALVQHLQGNINIHILDLKKSEIELACGFKFNIPLPLHCDVEESVDWIADLAQKKGLIGKNDVLVCFYAA